jgi:sulfite reductase (ferredoxin)
MANKPDKLSKPDKPSKVEVIKENSDLLRGNLAAGLQSESSGFDEQGVQLLKFHGLYQQENRDERKAARAATPATNGANGTALSDSPAQPAPRSAHEDRDGQNGLAPSEGPITPAQAPAARPGKSHSFMLRTRLPGGHLTAAQYLVHDDIADAYANGTLRITTRQCFQFHGLLKGDLQSTLRELNDTLITSLGACGDVVRNVVCCPAPIDDPIRRQIEAVTRQISDHLLPRTRAYHEIWLDNEKVYDGEKLAEDEPIYGKTYLPRKFKIAVAYPGDNCVDVYTQDIGLIAIVGAQTSPPGGRGEQAGTPALQETLLGFNVVVGGGMGMNHTKADTFPRLADPLGFITAEQVIDVVEKIVTVQRDYGNRTDRKYARMKYLIHNWGVERFREELESRLGYRLQPFAPMPLLHNELHLGWQEQGDGKWFLGLSVENGRVADVGERRLKSGLRATVEAFQIGVRLTPNHDILLTDILPEQRNLVEALLHTYGVDVSEPLSNIQLYSMACVALPTCGLAVAESERALPAVVDEIEQAAAQLGLADERISVRMTGCPNGCARPYVADIAFVGRSMDQYLLLVGGQSNGTRLNTAYKDLVHSRDLAVEVTALFDHFRAEREGAETFGDFCHRIGVDALRARADLYLAQQAASDGAGSVSDPNHNGSNHNGAGFDDSGHNTGERTHAGHTIVA